MKKSIIEVIKSNKKAIIKNTLIVGGTVVGLFTVGALLISEDDENDEVVLNEEETETIDVEVIETEEQN